MAILILMVGLPGGGKTTLAKQLEAERSAVRFTPDEWFGALVLDPYDEALRARIEALQWDCAARLLTLEIDVILDFGFWAREEREDYRARAAALGEATEIIFLDVPRAELWSRLSTRNADLPTGTFHVEEASLDAWWSMFEPPSREELLTKVETGTPDTPF